MSISGAVASVLLVVGVSACATGSDTTSPLATSGTLSIQVVGLDTTAAQAAGTVSVLRTDVAHQTPQAHSIPSNGLLELSVPAGTYSVSYVPPGGYNVAFYLPALPSSVPVTENATTELTFGVKPAKGTLFLLTNFVDASYPAYPGDGGTASVLRTDLADAVAYTTPIPNTVTDGFYVGIDLMPGTYRITYSPPVGYDLSGAPAYVLSGGATTIVIKPNAFESVAFDVAKKAP